VKRLICSESIVYFLIAAIKSGPPEFAARFDFPSKSLVHERISDRHCGVGAIE
jgi:hypothetical protein